jgi:hypothetical protein
VKRRALPFCKRPFLAHLFPPAYGRASKIIKSDGMTWKREVLLEEISRQLGEAADGACPDCARQNS